MKSMELKWDDWCVCFLRINTTNNAGVRFKITVVYCQKNRRNNSELHMA